MKKLLFYAAAVLAAISFSACSDDDEEPTLPATPGNIAGTWQLIHEKTWEKYGDGEEETWSESFPNEDGWYMTYMFDENGSFTETGYRHNEAYNTDHGSYSISGNELLIDDYALFEIKKLTKSRLVLIERGEDDIENASFEDIMTFKRIE